MEFQRTTAINKILKLKKRIRIIQGGTSAGKTFGIIPILIDQCTKNPGLEISVVSESIPHLRRGANKDFLKIMNSTGRYIDENYNKTLLKYTFSNKSYIEFFSADMEENVRGARRDILYINECNNIRFDTYHQLAIRTNETIFLDYNPSNEFWVQTELESDPDAEKIILTYTDNEALNDNIVREIEKARDKANESEYWANWWRVYGLGLQGTIEGVVFGKFKQVDQFPEDCKWVVYGMDFGYSNDPTTVTKIGFKEGELYFDEVIYRTGLTNSDIFSLCQQNGIGRLEVIADSAEPKSINELRSRGLNIHGAVKGKDSITNGIDLIKQHPVNITSSSLNLIKEWRNYSYKFDMLTNKYTNTPEDINNHCIDGIRYGVSYKLANRMTGRYATTNI